MNNIPSYNFEDFGNQHLVKSVSMLHKLTEHQEVMLNESHLIATDNLGYFGDEDAVKKLQKTGLLLKNYEQTIDNLEGTAVYEVSGNLVPYKSFLNSTKVDDKSLEKRSEVTRTVKKTLFALEQEGYVLGKEDGSNFSYEDIAFDEDTTRVVILPNGVFVGRKDTYIENIPSDMEDLNLDEIRNQKIGNQIVSSILNALGDGNPSPFINPKDLSNE